MFIKQHLLKAKLVGCSSFCLELEENSLFLRGLWCSLNFGGAVLLGDSWRASSSLNSLAVQITAVMWLSSTVCPK